MSLRFVIGRTGTGKTTLIFNEMVEMLKEEPEGFPVLYIVPEQMTFLSENRFIQTPGINGMIRTQVYSFTRLAWRILQETGGASRAHVSSVGLQMLIRKIIEDNKDELKLFKRAADKRGFIEHVETMLTEFKHYCIAPEELSLKQKEFAFGAATRALGDKLHDLELIYHKYEEALIGKYIDANDYLTLLADAIDQSNYLKDAEVYIDGFHSFTPQEYMVIERLMKNCRRVSVSLVLDRPFKHGMLPDELHLFRLTGESYSNLYELARNHQITIEEDVFLAGNQRFHGQGLYHLESRFDKRPAPIFEKGPAIQLMTAANRRAEMEGIAREIRKLVMEDKYRYQDIAILIRNGNDYKEMLETVFADYHIPYFMDQKQSMLNHPLIEFIRSALEVVSSSWGYEPVFRAVKTDLLYPLGSNVNALREQMDSLENYVLAYGIKGNYWTNEKQRWQYRRFQGLELYNAAQTDAEREMEEDINEARHMVASPLLRLSRRLKKAKNGRELCEALYLLLEELYIPEKLKEKSDAAEERGQLARARQHDQAWNAVIELLDQFVEIFGGEKLPLKKFIAVLESGLEAMKFSIIPPAMDQVFVADLELSRLSHMKATFVVGLNDGVIPAKLGEEGILSDDDREKLLESGLGVSGGSKRRLLDEDFIAYRALTSAAEKLYLSYPLANEEGKSLLASPYIKKIKSMFPKLSEVNIVNEPSEQLPEEQLAYVSHPNTAISYLTAQLELKKRHYPIADFWWDVYNFYVESPMWREKSRRILSSLFYQNETKKLTTQTSEQLYGDEILASVSRMELFHSCPFSHFISHGLKLRERDTFKLEAPHIGDLFHGALKWIADEINRKDLSWANLTKEQCEWLAREAVEYLAPKLQHQILLSSNRYYYIKRKLEQVIGRASFVLSSHAKSSGFVPVGIELAFGPHKELPPFAFTLKNGTKMQLQGRIDRVDKAEDENGVYLRVIDYKSSSRGLDVNEVYHGLALQMLTYLDIIVTHSQSLIGKEAIPAGVLYFHLHNPLIDSNQILTLDDLEQEIIKSFKMKGLLLGDPDVIRLMDTSLEIGSSDIVSARINRDGSLSAQSKRNSASPEDFALLKRYVRKLYQDAGDKIIAGNVEIDPYKMKDRTPCQFCSYRSICQFDQSLDANQYRIIQPQPSSEVLDRMRREEEI
ncbi:helicase-exonuclease AddAB subunit AddB [Bacillus sp. FJAT-50079]|uniref:helicase-exonuclease AddAB subunit AddB n=1 Tax=Bacillus sp. FJAT-50079 TaxID=2833577 RepID=UPI001BC8DB32|nr:helicase-exonuclease AddAB subunit AddB [Bacillus sp. FJAT-50079]MBS4210669.1 helicase-exonuclease AddAB subunit AddB [Bacillus sp. FJAT-50079]